MNDLINILKQYAPALATAVGGPVGGLVVQAIAQKLGVEASPSAVTAAIQADPQVALKLAEIDADQLKVEQENVTKRWEADMANTSWLANNIRPLTLIYLLTAYTGFAVASIFDYDTKSSYVELLGQWGMLVMSAYFGGRTLEKIMKK